MDVVVELMQRAMYLDLDPMEYALLAGPMTVVAIFALRIVALALGGVIDLLRNLY